MSIIRAYCQTAVSFKLILYLFRKAVFIQLLVLTSCNTCCRNMGGVDIYISPAEFTNWLTSPAVIHKILYVKYDG